MNVKISTIGIEKSMNEITNLVVLDTMANNCENISQEIIILDGGIN